jgi:hypothetical protein
VIKTFTFDNWTRDRREWMLRERSSPNHLDYDNWANLSKSNHSTVHIRNNHMIIRALRQNGIFYSAVVALQQNFAPSEYPGTLTEQSD